MRMADLIGKLVKSSQPINLDDEPASQYWSTGRPKKISGSLGSATRYEDILGNDAFQTLGGTEHVEMGSQSRLWDLGTSSVGIPQSVVIAPRSWDGPTTITTTNTNTNRSPTRVNLQGA
ncbi:hypothetical protein S40285_10716 [Stachybotrys chlorohalonatus IBT 40285]|uniref:Uncharacterized protein n=1 Tax=Stachybotrys chlorohalonatus (strain IBT 40285) TaxID=1283841 RepID=A0A084QZG9_STAC4|nr:hypothetical protein S40285_10716 [Stachybotrys chlorohalonata IBT 40285]